MSNLNEKVAKGAVWTLGDLVVVGSGSCRMEAKVRKNIGVAMKVENAATLRLFHGSRAGIAGRIAPSSRAECDFGKGFYLGTESSHEKKAEELGA